MRFTLCLCALMLCCAIPVDAQDEAPTPPGPKPERVDVSPRRTEIEAGEKLQFTATGFDDEGEAMDAKPTAWFAIPFDQAAADMEGNVTFFLPGSVRVGALINGQTGFATITVSPQAVSQLEISSTEGPIAAGTGILLTATARTSNGDPRTDVQIEWTSESPEIARVDAAGFVVGIAPGRAVLRASAGTANTSLSVDVIPNPVDVLSVTPATAGARTGDVIRFSAAALDSDGQTLEAPVVRWAVTGIGAMIESDGGFVAERPGSYVVNATSGNRTAVATVTVSPRFAERELEIVGQTEQEEFQSAEQWIIGNHAYLSSMMAGKLWVYDVSNPGNPLKVDSVSFDARVINDVSTTPDGKIGVITREGASDRKNGIVFLDLDEPAHPEVLSEYTETVTGGVHSAYIDDHYVYLTDDATGSLRVIDFGDAGNPKEVARWEVENPLVTTIETPVGEMMGGRMLHDVQVVDGLIYMGYWRDGLVILDVGAGIAGGSPEKPEFVSQLRFNYNELYGPDWLAGAHSVFRYNDYVFLGDEVFPAQFSLSSKDRIPVKGVVHVVDVSDIRNPRKVAEYAVPEAGAHNMWVENDVMYMGYYNGGGRVVDVSGELRGNLYRQGREMARLWTGSPDGYRPNLPFAWGAQPHNGLIYFNDTNTGIWVTRIVDPRDREP